MPVVGRIWHYCRAVERLQCRKHQHDVHSMRQQPNCDLSLGDGQPQCLSQAGRGLAAILHADGNSGTCQLVGNNWCPAAFHRRIRLRPYLPQSTDGVIATTVRIAGLAPRAVPSGAMPCAEHHHRVEGFFPGRRSWAVCDPRGQFARPRWCESSCDAQ